LDMESLAYGKSIAKSNGIWSAGRETNLKTCGAIMVICEHV